MSGRRYRRKPKTRDGARRLSGSPNHALDTSPYEYDSYYEIEHLYLRESLAERIERLAEDVKLEPIHLLQVLLIEGLRTLEPLPVDQVRDHIHGSVNLKELLP